MCLEDQKVLTLADTRPLSSGTRQVSSINALMNTVQDPNNFEYKEKDERVKIAILDTGIDLTDPEWEQGRMLRFEEGAPVRENNEPPQMTRIREFKNFCTPKEPKAVDLDGHGTQVAGIILQLAPRAEIYVARVCEGDKNRDISATQPGTTESPRGIQPKATVDAIDWAIEKKVHLINMSYGFSSSYGEIEEALERAKAAKIITLAAMSNDGNNEGPAWPAKEPSLTIGVHSCKDLGMSPSDFTPKAVHKSDNFMAVGENILTHWPKSKGGGFWMDDGTSFATPVVTAMAALILAFVFQTVCKEERKKVIETFYRGKVYGKDFGRKDPILKMERMAAMLREISEPGGSAKQYHYIHPRLLWKDFDHRKRDVEDTNVERRKYAWGIIRDVLL